MLKVEITKDNFMNGRTKVPKGTVIEVAPPIARYIVRNNDGKIVGEVEEIVKKPAKKPPPKKKATYKTRDMKADE